MIKNFIRKIGSAHSPMTPAIRQPLNRSAVERLGPKIIAATPRAPEIAPFTRKIAPYALSPQIMVPKVIQAANHAGIVSTKETPGFSAEKATQKILESDPVKKTIDAVLKRETAGQEKIQTFTTEIKKTLAKVDSLLDLHAELIALPEQDSHQLSEKVNQMIGDLKENGIELWPNGAKTITKDKLSELKSHISSQIQKCQMKVETILKNDIGVEMQWIQTILNSLQQMIQSDTRLKKHVSERSSGR
jgi:hypothetical protein